MWPGDGLHGESRRDNGHAVGLSDEELGDDAGGGVGGGAEGGAARRGHALAVNWAEVCCTDERRSSTRRERVPTRPRVSQAQVDSPSQAFPVYW